MEKNVLATTAQQQAPLRRNGPNLPPDVDKCKKSHPYSTLKGIALISLDKTNTFWRVLVTYLKT